MHAALQVLKDMNYIEGLGVAALADPSLRRHVEPRVFLREVTRLRQGTPVVKAMTRRERVAHERAALRVTMSNEEGHQTKVETCRACDECRSKRDADGGCAGRSAPFETREGRRRLWTARDCARCTRIGCHTTTTRERCDTADRLRSCRGHGLGAGGIPLCWKASREAFAPRLGDYSPCGVEDGVTLCGIFEPSAE